MQTPCVCCIFRPRPLRNIPCVRCLLVASPLLGSFGKFPSQLRSVSALRAKTVRKPHGLETTRARYSFLNFGSVPSCALFGLVLVFWHRFDGSWCYCGLLCFHRRRFPRVNCHSNRSIVGCLIPCIYEFVVVFYEQMFIPHSS